MTGIARVMQMVVRAISRTGRLPREDRIMTIFYQTGLAAVGAPALLVLVPVPVARQSG